MITVAEAEQIILAQTRDYGTELCDYSKALGRVLAEDIKADRDLPPYDRVTMDGIAIRYAAFEHGVRTFNIKATMAAGDDPLDITKDNECIELMTGCALPSTTDTVIRYEDLDIQNEIATVTVEKIREGQYIHYQGADKQQGQTVVKAGQYIDASVVSMAGSVGKTQLPVKKNPKVVIVSTGDEVVEVGETPTPYQVRQSNNHMLKAILRQHAVDAEILHVNDDEKEIRRKLGNCLLQNDVLILSGGISMGKYDYIPQALSELGVKQLFHKVQQRPGKPFWFGALQQKVLFAFPGNPVSTFMCAHRYFLPWLHASFGIKPEPSFAILDHEVTFTAPLQYFLQVRLSTNKYGQLVAKPVEGNGSGDFSNLLRSNAFMELPADQDEFLKGEVYRVWPFKPMI
jgi:molybdopterin molybdotransferase